MVEWWKDSVKAVSSEFDKHGVEYFTQERFDFWYPGYGDSWPTYNGALSGTFEQASVRGIDYSGTMKSSCTIRMRSGIIFFPHLRQQALQPVIAKRDCGISTGFGNPR